MSLENANTNGGASEGLRIRHIVSCVTEIYPDQDANEVCVEVGCEAVDKYHKGKAGVFYVYPISHIIEMFKYAAGSSNYGNLYITTVVFLQSIIEYFLFMASIAMASVISKTKEQDNAQDYSKISRGKGNLSTSKDPRRGDSIKGLLENIKETDQLYTEDLNETIDNINKEKVGVFPDFDESNDDAHPDRRVYVHWFIDDCQYGEGDKPKEDFKQLLPILPIKHLQTIAKMLSVDIQACLDKKKCN
ncbi:hypothetical protein DFA_05108 [Cavenderia fasciculata]|uniref:Uncharacterized protein n=1 Tax=Cavenderia fasciculata TaxID=261658 RepID=F4PNC5_CACFS|nr:uncharacterized protein DFA_05108 [Cavenderia fasciculata]EGG22978.1 hypothetical protein DFA_05108 [Cavenderia fasciculata]|eukprot:XP_004360829.1 hypothetical protein DFA_05108 [Cavenderia fasciculata]